MAYTEARRTRHREYMRERYQNDEEHRARQKAAVRSYEARRKTEVRALIQERKAQGCALCPENVACCLSFHHVHGVKKFSIADSHRVGPRLMAEELTKCVVVCENCHRKLHAGLLSLPASILRDAGGSDGKTPAS